MSAKLATTDLLKIKTLWKKLYDVIIFVIGITNKIIFLFGMCSCDQIFFSSIYITEDTITSVLQEYYQKTQYFTRMVLAQVK